MAVRPEQFIQGRVSARLSGQRDRAADRNYRQNRSPQVFSPWVSRV
jgi:hypothetical protein